jgi:hypothetical protein
MLRGEIIDVEVDLNILKADYVSRRAVLADTKGADDTGILGKSSMV